MIDYELAKQLKETGFPQPAESKFGQIWYSEVTMTKAVIIHESVVLDKDMVFCPTFEDIWAQLPNIINFDYTKCMSNAALWYNGEAKRAIYRQYIEDNDISAAAAKLWLTLKEKNLL